MVSKRPPPALSKELRGLLFQVIVRSLQVISATAYARFFTPTSVQGDSLIHRPYANLTRTYRVPRNEMGAFDPSTLADRLHLPVRTEVRIGEARAAKDKVSFIYRARYRV